jgi:hypothetical protein
MARTKWDLFIKKQQCAAQTLKIQDKSYPCGNSKHTIVKPKLVNSPDAKEEANRIILEP